MDRCKDPADPLNAATYHTGKRCIERGCERPAGTAWSKLWCQPCNADRMVRISDSMNRMTKAGETASGITPPAVIG